ncbi:MAG: glycine zipper family protein, partial [Thermomicrobiales bacterium]|nr:glycine zipper family protein [Thermomicrobiales bacterium]
GLGIVLGQLWLGLPIGLVTGVALGVVVGAALMAMQSKRR